ncbi:MAG: hypothetical protein E2O65_03880 [Gammaproteobacteria bacterium]|nr:MAG: hypothetical protein E2O65_03880 [Gammaproteobacteria bacterium]
MLSGKPNFSNSVAPLEADNCKSYPSLQAIFSEYSEKSTVGILAELRLINAKLFPVTRKTDPDDGALYPDENSDAHAFRARLLNAINEFLNPDAVVPLRVKTLETFSVDDYRKAFTESFYGIGPTELWYGDVFAG